MRKRLIFALLLTALVIPATAAAAYLNAGQRGLTTCAGISGTTEWHFVNNQYGDADPEDARLFASFSGGINVGPVAPTDYNNGTIHWWIDTASGATLLNAYTVLDGSTTQVPGRLVLSECRKKG